MTSASASFLVWFQESTPGRLLTAVGLAILTLALFSSAVDFGFIEYDDSLYVRDNLHVSAGLTPANVRWAFTNTDQQWWLPLLWISFQLDTELFGPEPLGYHLTNILLHALNAALLFWVLSRLTKTFWPAAFIAALFAVHPLRVEAVVWITSRKDVLSGLFFMLALLAHLRFVERPTPIRRWLVAALMLCGLLSKGILVILPPILLLLDYWPLQRAGDPFERREWPAWGRLLLEKWPLIVLAVLFTGIGLWTHATARGSTATVPMITRLALIFPNYWAYIGKLLWPHPLSLIYPEKDVLVGWQFLLALAGLSAVTAFVFRLRKTHPALAVGWLWFLLGLVPVIRGVRLGIAALADRFTYLPSIGFFLLLVWGVLILIPPQPKIRLTLTLAATAVLFAAACATGRYLRLWRDSETLFRHCLAVTRDNYTIETNLANVLWREKRKTEAIVHWRNAVRIVPDYAMVHTALATALRETGDSAAAARHLDAAMRFVRPHDAGVLAGIAAELAITGKHQQALEFYRRSFEIKPDQPWAQLDYAAAVMQIGHPAEALTAAEEVLHRHPDNNRAHFSRAQALLALDRANEAVSALENAVRLTPTKIEYQSALALALAAAGRAPEAVARLRKMIRQKPDSPHLLNNLAWLLVEKPDSPVYDPAAAVKAAARAAELSQRKDPRILHTLALAYAANGQSELARQACEEAEPLARQAKLDDLAVDLRTLAETCQ